MLVKVCCKCGEAQPHYVVKSGPRKGKAYSWCKPCANRYNRAQFQKHKDNWQQTRKAYHRLWKYGITLDEYETLLQSTNGECQVCNQIRPLVLDHDHETGKVRGILCAKCNSALGLFGDSVANLKQAIAYLEETCGE